MLSGALLVAGTIVNKIDDISKLYQFVKECLKETDELSIEDKSDLEQLRTKYERIYRGEAEGKAEAKTIPLAFTTVVEGGRIFPAIIPPLHSLKPETYEEGEAYGENTISTEVKACVALICHYQNVRSVKKTADAVGLFCYFAKQLLIQFSKQDLDTRAALEAIQRFIEFIKEIFFTRTIFSTARKPPSTIKTAATDISNIAKNLYGKLVSTQYEPIMVNPEYSIDRLFAEVSKRLIDIEKIALARISNLTMRELSKILRSHIQNAFYVGIEIALRIPTQGKLATCVTPYSMLDAAELKIPGFSEPTKRDEAIKQHIYALLEHNPFNKIIMDDKAEAVFAYDHPHKKWQAHSRLTKLELDKNLATGFRSIPGVVAVVLTENTPPWALNKYLKFLAMLELLAENYKLVTLTYNLAGEIGNWGIYNQLGAHITLLCNIIIAITKQLKNTLGDLEQYLIRAKNKKEIEKLPDTPWYDHIDDVVRMKPIFDDILEKKLMATCNDIQNDYKAYQHYRAEKAAKITADISALIVGVKRSAAYLTEIGILDIVAEPVPEEDVFFAVSSNGKSFTCMGEFLVEAGTNLNATPAVVENAKKNAAKIVLIKAEISEMESAGQVLMEESAATLTKIGFFAEPSTQITPEPELKNELEAELEICKQRLEQDPYDLELLMLKGTALQALGRYSEAIEIFNQVLNFHPHDAEAKAALASIPSVRTI